MPQVGRLRRPEDESGVEEDHADVAYEEDRDARFDLGPLGPPDVRLGRRDGDGDGDGDDAPLGVDGRRLARKSSPRRQLPVCEASGDIEWVGRVDDDDDEEDSSEYDSNFIDSDDDDDDEYDSTILSIQILSIQTRRRRRQERLVWRSKRAPVVDISSNRSRRTRARWFAKR